VLPRLPCFLRVSSRVIGVALWLLLLLRVAVLLLRAAAFVRD
jgi:hypothetical protein